MGGVAYGIQITDKSAAKALERLGADMFQVRRKTLARVGNRLVGYIQTEKLRGDPLSRQSGHLAQGLHYVWIGPTAIFFGPAVKYGAIHEYGGTIVPVNKKALRWFDEEGNPVFAKRVEIPAQPWLEPGIREYFQSGRAERLVDATLIVEWRRIEGETRGRR